MSPDEQRAEILARLRGQSPLTKQEESGILTSKLTDPSITPAPDGNALRDRIANGPSSGERGIGTRLAEAGGELARFTSKTPLALGLMGPVGLGATLVADTAGVLPSYDHTKPAPTKADPNLWAKTQELKPMESAPVAVPSAPALDQKYTQVGRSMGGGGAGGASPAGGLRAAVDAAHKRQLGIYDEAASLQRELGVDKAAQVQAVAGLNEEEAARQ